MQLFYFAYNGFTNTSLSKARFNVRKFVTKKHQLIWLIGKLIMDIGKLLVDGPVLLLPMPVIVAANGVIAGFATGRCLAADILIGAC